ncbi:hypothetical protein Aperf_G00000111172 [Anoplocephala perfoliata]
MFSKKLLFSIVGLYLPFAKEHASKKACEVTVDMMYGSMRGIKAFVTETPLLDPEEGWKCQCTYMSSCLFRSSDPYLSLSAAMCGLAGPLHDLANQEVLMWITDLVKNKGKSFTDEQVIEFAKETLDKGKTDPRYMCQREFALAHMSDGPLVEIVAQCYKLIPPYLGTLAKIKNPWPNVDAHSSVLLQHFNMTEISFYTVLFGVFRSLGVCASLVSYRTVGLPVERPKSMSTEGLRALFEANKEDDFSDDIFMAGQKQYSNTYHKAFAMSTSEQSSSELPNRSDELHTSWIHVLQYEATLGSELCSYRGLAEEALAS